MTQSAIRRSWLGPYEAVVLETADVRAVVLPALGGRIWELEDKSRKRQWIWHRELERLQANPVGANYDAVWAGGWEELFPNDAPGRFEGRDLPDHGEWWATPWHVEGIEDGSVPALRLRAHMKLVRAVCTKEIRVPPGRSLLQIRYGIQSDEPLPFHFLFKQHLPIRLTPGCLLQLPGGMVRAVDPSFGSQVQTGSEFVWPRVPGRPGADLRRMPPESSGEREFLYVRDLPEPWCGIDDPESGASLRLRFDHSVFRYVWLFLTYGGWQGTHVAVLEPCTNCPKDLAEAVRLGQSARLDPGRELRTELSVELSQLLPNTQSVPQNARPLSETQEETS